MLTQNHLMFSKLQRGIDFANVCFHFLALPATASHIRRLQTGTDGIHTFIGKQTPNEQLSFTISCEELIMPGGVDVRKHHFWTSSTPPCLKKEALLFPSLRITGFFSWRWGLNASHIWEISTAPWWSKTRVLCEHFCNFSVSFQII